MIRLSILDRLMGVDPGLDPASKFRAGMMRDIQELLNTFREREPVPAELAEASNSLLTYGLPDLSAATVTSTPDQDTMRRAIDQALRKFEPRLAHVRVLPVEASPVSPVFQFRVEAGLQLDGGEPEPISFDTRFERASARFQVVPR